MKLVRYILGMAILLSLSLIGFNFNGAEAAPAKMSTNQSCIPKAGWSQVVHHDAVTHVAHHDAVTHTIHHDAVTHVAHHDAVTHVVHHPAETQTIHHAAVTHVEYAYQKQAQQRDGSWVDFQAGKPGFYIDWSKTEQSKIYYEGAWRVIDQPFHLGSGTYRWHESTKTVTDKAAYDEIITTKAAWDETVVDKAAYDETVTDKAAYDETVVDKAAYDETVTDKMAYDTTIYHAGTTCPTSTHFTPHIKVIDKCSCKHDNVIVKHDKRIQFSKVAQVNKTTWKVHLIGEDGVLLPKNIKHPNKGWARNVTYKFHTTNMPCPCAKSGTCHHAAPKPAPKPAPAPCGCNPRLKS